jgi:THO complex subunit 7
VVPNTPTDQIVLSRLVNDERPLRRVLRKFHQYLSLLPSQSPSSVEEARESFLLELDSFQLTLQKSLLICEADARQVEEYQREQQRLGELQFLHDTSHWLQMTSMAPCAGR